MGQNYEKEFFEQFESSSSKEQPLDSLSDLYAEDDQLDEFAELSELILRFQDGEIDQKQFMRLQEWLLSDNKAIEYYIDFTCLYVGLSILLNKKHDNSFLKPISMV